MEYGCPTGDDMKWIKGITDEKINKILALSAWHYNAKDRHERSPAIKAMDMDWSKKKKEGKSVEMFQPLVDGAIEIIKMH